jgi:hypothetical protein
MRACLLRGADLFLALLKRCRVEAVAVGVEQVGKEYHVEYFEAGLQAVIE